MRIDTIGIYNNKGLVQNRNKNIGAQNYAGDPNTANVDKTKFSQKLKIPKSAEAISQLSSAELSQIRKLFGQVDISALKDLENHSLDDSPGQFIDIVI